ncbi:MAG TPA: HlyD family efflux transporter periplasmic adaptor subunit, partial [Polyangiales bacterium]|nr:HlyD family efflux transporter periplasmic adaptor subunit [Polyangiales bacterium]
TAWGMRLLVVALCAAAYFVAVGRVNEYASGPALVRIDGRTALSSTHAALVRSVEVKPGDQVEEGQVLLQLFSSEEASDLEAATREFDDQLVKLMQRPNDAHAREALVTLRTRRELARSRLEQRSMRAPHRGVVGDVRVRAGQLIEPGVAVLELRGEQADTNVVALLPGRYRPLLKPGAKLRFELDGFHRRAHELTVQDVGDQIVGPAEAVRYLGREQADSMQLSGPVVLVQASLPSGSFEADGERFEFAHGMHGKAETIVRNEPVAYAFLPGLKQWVERVWQ